MDSEEKCRRLVEASKRKKARKKRAECAQRLDRVWAERFCACFPPDFKIVGPKNEPEYLSPDFPGDFPGVVYLELRWQGRQKKDAGLGAVCPYCGARSEQIHEYKDRLVYDLPFCRAGKTELCLSFPRYQCLNPACARGFAPEFMDPLDIGRRNLSSRLQEFVFLLADRVRAETASRILEEMGIVDECGKSVCSGDTVLRIKREFARDSEICKYLLPETKKATKVDLEVCAGKLQYGLIEASEELMTVQERRDTNNGTEIHLRPRGKRLAAIKRVLDQTF